MIRIIRKLKKRRGKRRHKPLLILGLIILIYSIGGGAFEFFLPIWINDLVNKFAIDGFLLALPSLIDLFLDIPIGDLSDKLGRRKVMLFGLGILIVLGILLQHVTTIILLAIFLLLWGFAYQLFNIPSTAYVMDISPKGKFSEYFGAYMTFLFLGLAIGPVIAGFLLVSNENLIPYFYSLTCGISLIIVLFALKRIIKSPESISEGIKELIKKDKVFMKEIMDFKELKVTGLLVLYLTFILAFCELVIWTFEPLYFQNLLINPVFGGLILSSFVLPLVLFEIPAGILADKYGKRKILMLGLLISGISLLFFGFSNNQYNLLIFAFLTTTGLALALPSIEGILMDISIRYKKGEIAGVWNFAEDLGFVAGPLFGGLIAQYYGLGNAFVFVGLILLLSILPVILVLKKS